MALSELRADPLSDLTLHLVDGFWRALVERVGFETVDRSAYGEFLEVHKVGG